MQVQSVIKMPLQLQAYGAMLLLLLFVILICVHIFSLKLHQMRTFLLVPCKFYLRFEKDGVRFTKSRRFISPVISAMCVCVSDYVNVLFLSRRCWKTSFERRTGNWHRTPLRNKWLASPICSGWRTRRNMERCPRHRSVDGSVCFFIWD